MMTEKTTIQATLEAVSQFTQSLETKLADLTMEMRTSIVLAMQELLVNIVKHAYDGASGQIDIELEQSPHRIHITVLDHGMNTFETPDKITAPDPLDLPEHGMGLFIIHQSFDNVQYKRLSSDNQWQLTKELG